MVLSIAQSRGFATQQSLHRLDQPRTRVQVKTQSENRDVEYGVHGQKAKVPPLAVVRHVQSSQININDSILTKLTVLSSTRVEQLRLARISKRTGILTTRLSIRPLEDIDLL
jgi:hypothetical protein